MSTSTQKLIFLLLIPLSAGEGCGQKVKPFKSKFEKKKPPTVSTKKQLTDPKPKPRSKNGSPKKVTVEVTNKNVAVTNGNPVITNESSAEIVDPEVATLPPQPATATQEQTDQLAPDTILITSDQEEQGRGDRGDFETAQSQDKQPAKPSKMTEWIVEKNPLIKWVKGLKIYSPKKQKKANRDSNEAE